MPKRNRVSALGSIHAVPQRGSWMGNRGQLHRPDGTLKTFSQGKRWIICELEFRGIRREVMSPGKYTELFFLDEATAFAAGHRPCNECRRESAQSFLKLSGFKNLSGLDEQLHSERMQHEEMIEDFRTLPNGACVLDNNVEIRVVWKGELWKWSFDGYSDPISEHPEPVRLQTPSTTVEVLRSGYPVQVHPSLHRS